MNKYPGLETSRLLPYTNTWQLHFCFRDIERRVDEKRQLVLENGRPRILLSGETSEACKIKPLKGMLDRCGLYIFQSYYRYEHEIWSFQPEFFPLLILGFIHNLFELENYN